MDGLENVGVEQEVQTEEVAETDEYGLEEDDFLASLEELEREEQEEQREKNRNAEEARKRREREAKERAERESVSEEQSKEEPKQAEPQEEDNTADIQKQFEDFTAKYPDVTLTDLKYDKDFNEYIDGKWEKGGKTLTELYESYNDFRTRLSHNERRTATPSLKGSSSSSVGNDEYFTQEELTQIRAKMPYMNSKQFNAIAEKYKNSIKYHKGE